MFESVCGESQTFGDATLSTITNDFIPEGLTGLCAGLVLGLFRALVLRKLEISRGDPVFCVFAITM